MQQLKQKLQAFFQDTHNYPWLLLALCLLLFVANTNGYALFDVDEPRYMETARAMLKVPPYDWNTPHFNGLLRFDKPILFYWLIAISYKVFGVSEFAGRFVSALAATATVLSVYRVAKHYTSPKQALLSSLILMTSVEFFVLSRWAITDMTLSFFLVATTLCLFQAIHQSRNWAFLAGIFCGLGLLTKGPIALVLPGAIAFCYTLIYARPQLKWLLNWRTLLGALLAFAVAAPWYWAVDKANPGVFFEQFFILHNVTRFTQTVSSHEGPFYYYVLVILVGGMPWVLLMAWQKLRHYKQVWLLTFKKGIAEQSPLFRFSLVWFLVTFLFFSVAQTKLLTYILSLFPALAILYPFYFKHVYSERFLFKTAAVMAALCLFANYSVFPIAADMCDGGLLAYARKVKEDNAALATFESKRPSLVFYTQNKVYYLPHKSHTAPPKNKSDFVTIQDRPVYVIFKARQQAVFQEQYEAEIIATKGRYALARLQHPETVLLRKDINQ